MTKALVISAPSSGAGKTSVTLGLLAALARRGVEVAPFKAGPDFIDPGLHTLVCGVKSHNLDSWMLPPQANREIFARHAQGAQVAVVEGGMGLFDGFSGAGGPGSAAHVAKLLGLPVLLVADARGMAASMAALVQGFARFDPQLPFVGVVCNRVGGRGHRSILTQALDQAGVPLLGLLRREADIALPSRHLGLVTAQDLNAAPDWPHRLADWLESGLDLDALLAALPDIPLSAPPEGAAVPVRAVRLGVAWDRAFCFLYDENLRLLRAAGAELVFFSPLKDEALPPNLDGLYLPGGYPELHAEALTGNSRLRREIRGFCASGRPVYAECGGFMYLMQALWDRQGRKWPMVGVFPFQARLGQGFAALGYREARFTAATPLGPVGTTARGHEFHYSSLMAPERPAGVYALSGRNGLLDASDGFASGNVLAAYTHLHFASNPRLAQAFVRAMAAS